MSHVAAYFVVKVRTSSRRGLFLFPLSAAMSFSAGAQAVPGADAPSDMARILGLSVTASGGPRDTLGLLIASVTRDGPADQAGITVGSRVLAVNGLQVRLAPSDIGRRAAADSALIKFDRALRVTPPGRDAMIRLAGFGQTRLVSVKFGNRRSVDVNAPVAVTAAPDVSTGGTPPSADSSQRRTPALLTPNATPPLPSADAVASVAAEVVNVPVSAAPISVAPPSIPIPAPESVAGNPNAMRQPRSASALADALGDIQLELRRLARESRSLATSDSLAELDASVGALRRRLRALAPESLVMPTRADTVGTRGGSVAPSAVPMINAPAVGPSSAAPVAVAPSVANTPTTNTSGTKAGAGTGSTRVTAPGLELSRVTGELATYLGTQGDMALSVVGATDAWEPMRAGDVITLVDGTPPDAERLRRALETHQRISVTLLRRGRSFTVLLGEIEAR
jgi:hypothetical protein